MSALDTLAEKAQSASERLAGGGGIKDKLAAELADDAVFLRKLKPALVRRRLRGETPAVPPPAAPSGPQLGKRPKTTGRGPNPYVVVGAAFVLGIAAARLIDWRGHAHPRW